MIPLSLSGRKVAILASDGFEQVELTAPRMALEQAGAFVDIISLKAGTIQGYRHMEKGDRIPVTHIIDDVAEEDYDALVLPGGVINPDQLRTKENVQDFVRAFINADKPVAAICHAPWILIDAQVVAGRVITSVKSVRIDLENADARWVDEEVAVDGHLITSRGPDDLPAFCGTLIKMLAEIHQPAVESTIAFI